MVKAEVYDVVGIMRAKLYLDNRSVVSGNWRKYERIIGGEYVKI